MSDQRIKIENGQLVVPDNPIIPFIEGDGIGVDIWPAAQFVFDTAVSKAYGGKRKITWLEVMAGEKSFNQTGEWLPAKTLDAFRDYLIGIKGPLSTPIGGGITSLNVALRQILDLYVCLRPVKYITGVPAPVKRPEDVDMVIFRENTEDIYAGIEWAAGTPEVKKVIEFLQKEMGVTKIRFPETSGIGIKPISKEGTSRLAKSAIEYALREKRRSVTFVHKGNIMKFTEGAFKTWGYEVGTTQFRNQIVTERESWILDNQDKNSGLSVEENARLVDPGYDMMTESQKAKIRAEIETALTLYPTHGNGQWKKMLLLKDSIADITLQQVLTRPKEFDVIVTPNLNGDYLSDALAAQIGGIGIAPGANINYLTGHAVFEATHGTAPKYAGLDKVNPSSVILSGVIMLEYMGWKEAADLIVKGINSAIAAKTVTYDFARLMDGATEVSCSGFAKAIVSHM